MASTVKHLRSSTANKRPTASGLSDGQLGINTASGTPGVFFKDSAGTVTKVGPAHVGSTAPNVSPAGSAGNSLGELWVDNSTTINGLNYYTGSAFVNLTPSGTTTVAGLVELATNAETQTGTDTVRAVTPSGLQSKISDSTSTTSSTTIASATAVKAAYDLADAALPKAGGRVTGNLEIGPAGSLSFEGSTDDSFETTLAVVDPTADRTITFPNVTGTVVTTGDSGTVTSTMILDGTIVNADINASAAIALSKLATGALPSGITVASANIVDGTIVNADVNASAAIAGTKISPDFGSQNRTSTGTSTAASFIPTGSSVPTNGVYLPATNSVAISTNGTGRLFVDASGLVGLGTSSPGDLLHVQGSTSPTIRLSNSTVGSAASPTSTFIDFRGFNAAIRARIEAQDRSSNFTGGTLNIGTANTSNVIVNAIHIDNAQRVGIGTTVPSEFLTVNNSANSAAIAVRTGGAALNAVVKFNADDANYAGIGLENTALVMRCSNSSTPTERARIDSSGRLLVGTSTGLTVFNYRQSGGNLGSLQVATVGAGANTPTLASFAAATYAQQLSFTKSRGTTVGDYTIVQDGDNLGSIFFFGADGTDISTAGAGITAQVDGTPGSDDMPGRLVMSVTLDGASTPTEAFRITNDRVRAYNQAAPAAVNATSTLTAANLKTGIITSTSAAATDMTLPTGTDTEGGFSGIYTNMTFEWSVINTGPSLVTVLANTAHTLVGSGAVATGTSARFASRRTASNTFVSYRLS
jgi:hypothetical protein